MRHYYIKVGDFMRAVQELFKSTERVKFEWTNEESDCPPSWYAEDYSLWLKKVQVEGKSDSSNVVYRRLVWKRFTEKNYTDDQFLMPLANKLDLDPGQLKMIYARKDILTQKGWSDTDEVILGYEDPTAD